MTGLGDVSVRWLEAVGIKSPQQLKRIGAVKAYRRIRDAGFKPTLNLLWALHGAINDLHWTLISPNEREELKKALDSK